MSLDDLPPATAPYYRHPSDGAIELLVPRPDGSAEVHQIPDHVAHIHLVDLSVALLRRRPRPIDPPGREPA